MKNQINIKPSMIILNEQTGVKKKRDGTEEPIMKQSLNVDFWRDIKEPINVTIDEAHTIINARKSMSKVNIIVTDWLALIRRVLGSSDAGFGELTFISQLHNRIDIIAREMATNIIFTMCHFMKTCKKCKTTWRENSEMPEGYNICPNCRNWNMLKHSHTLEVWKFPTMQLYIAWKEWGQNSYYSHFFVTDIEKYFPLYNTLQWDNMFSEFY